MALLNDEKNKEQIESMRKERDRRLDQASGAKIQLALP